MMHKDDPRQLAKVANSAYQHRQYIHSAETYHAARLTFEAVNNFLDAAEMANNSSVAYLMASQADLALAELEGLEEYFSNTADSRRLGITLGNRAAALEALDRQDEAMLTYQQSIEFLEKAGDDQLRASALQSLSALQLKCGKQLQALVSMKQGIDGLKKPTAVQKMLKHMLNIPFDMMSKNS